MRKALLVMLFTMFPVLAHGATTYYVAPTGSDSNSCNSAKSQSTPKLTINVGVGCLSAGDTLCVKEGTYDELLNCVVPLGIAGKPKIIYSSQRILDMDSDVWTGQGCQPMTNAVHMASAQGPEALKRRESNMLENLNPITVAMGILGSEVSLLALIRYLKGLRKIQIESDKRTITFSVSTQVENNNAIVALHKEDLNSTHEQEEGLSRATDCSPQAEATSRRLDRRASGGQRRDQGQEETNDHVKSKRTAARTKQDRKKSH